MLLVIESKAVRGRLEHPRSCVEIERFLAPWLRSGRENEGGNGAAPRDAAPTELSSLPRE
jgi:hypothetical protein